MDPLIIQKFAVFQKQSAIGSVVLFFQSLRKNSFNFIYLLFPAIKGNVKISIFLFLGFVLLIALFAYIKYYYFKYKFDFEKSAFVVHKGFLEKTNLSIPFEKIQQININQNLIHKLFNLYEIQMDTAGSSSTEVDIKAVSKSAANDFKVIAEEIKKLSLSATDSEPLSKTEASFEIALKTLIKTGLTTRYFETLSLIIGGLFLGLQLLDDYELSFASDLTDIAKEADYSYGLITCLVLGVIATVLLTNLITTVIKFYKYKATRSSKNLEIKYGLIKTKSVLLSPQKVQQFKTTQNWFQKLLNILDIKINQASSEVSSTKDVRSNVKVPGCTLAQKQVLFDFIYGKAIGEEIILKPNLRKFIINFMFFSLLPSTGLLMMHLNIDFFKGHYWRLLALSFFIVTLYAAWRFYKNNVLFISKNFIRSQSGFWDVTTTHVEHYKIQSAIISQPIWYKNSDLGDLLIFTAGGQIRVGGYNYTALKLILNNVLYNVETSKRKWM